MLLLLAVGLPDPCWHDVCSTWVSKLLHCCLIAERIWQASCGIQPGPFLLKQEEAFDIADQVVVFNRGLVEQSGTPEQLQTAPQTPFVMQFVSDTNTLPTHHAVTTPCCYPSVL